MFKTVALAGALAAVAYADHADGEPFTTFTAIIGPTHTHEYEVTKSGITVKVISNNVWSEFGNLHETLISFNGGEQQKINVETYYNAETATFDQTRSFNDDCTWNLAEETLNQWKSCGVYPGSSKNVAMRSNVDIGGNVSTRIVGSDWVAETRWPNSEYFSIYVDLETQTWHETLFVKDTKVAEIKWVFPAFNNPDDPYWACRRSVESQQSYHRFAMLMAKSYPEYSWEAIPVETADGYHLTTFHVWHEQNRDKSLGPVFFQHGGTQDGASWLQDAGQDGGIAPHIQMASKGFDVYIGSNRGTEYSSGHGSHAYSSAAYWDFNLEHYADDLLANMRAMNTDSGKKGWYFGYSMGTMQMLIGLSKFEEELKGYLNKAILIAPCTFLADAQINVPGFEALIAPNRLQDETAKLGIYAFNGPNWDAEAICKDGPEDLCTWASLTPEYQPVGIQLQTQFIQMSFAKRFQPYMKEWTLETATDGVLYDLEGIASVPITMIVGGTDDTCPASYADDLAKRLSTLQKHIEIKDEGHEFFQFGNRSEYVDMLFAEATAEVTEAGAAVEKQIVEFEKIDNSVSDAPLGGIVATDTDVDKKKEGALTLAPFFALLFTATQLLLQ